LTRINDLSALHRRHCVPRLHWRPTSGCGNGN